MSVHRFCAEWARMAAGDNVDTMTASREWKSVNVFYKGRYIYSYGQHFIMGYILAPGLVWLNGDRYSHTTSRHQSELRAACQRAGLTYVIVPGSALQGARVDYRTIMPVAIEPERFDYTRHAGDAPPESMVTEPPRGPYNYILTGDGDYRTPSITFDDGAPVWSDTRKPATDYAGYIVTGGRRCAVMRDNGRYVWHTVTHWLGDSVFTAERRLRASWVNDESPAERVYWISSFDHQERRPLYFLSQLPGPVDTVTAAIESLAPDSVKTARDMGRVVVRQGDVFAIETMVSTRELKHSGATIERRRVTIEYSLDARRRMHVRDGLRAIVDTMPPVPARVYYGRELSRGAFDAMREWHDERVREWTDTVIGRYTAADHAAAQWAGMRTFYDIGSALGYAPRVWDRTREVTGASLMGTAHTATEVATMPDGSQYARGVMYHEPAVIGDHRRRADHARRQLPGRRWYLITRNTVPVESR